MFGVTGSGDTSGYGRLVRTTPTPGSSNRPFGGDFDYVADELERAFPAFNDAIEKIVVDRGEPFAPQVGPFARVGDRAEQGRAEHEHHRAGRDLEFVDAGVTVGVEADGGRHVA